MSVHTCSDCCNSSLTLLISNSSASISAYVKSVFTLASAYFGVADCLERSGISCRISHLREDVGVTLVGSVGRFRVGTSSDLSFLPREFTKCLLHTQVDSFSGRFFLAIL